MSDIPSKIQSFFNKGFLPGGGSLDVSKSYDSTSREAVALNCISKIEGIATSLIHQAKGGLAVMIEEKIGGGGILDAALKRTKEKIKEKEEEFKLIISSSYFATVAARNEVLKKDRKFIDDISTKAHQTALFVLNLQVRPGENRSEDGCKEVGRLLIKPGKIDKVLVSDKTKIQANHAKIIRVSSKSMKINFSYKDEKENSQTIREIGPIDVPDYQQALLKLAQDKRLPLSKSPIYTHMTRL